MLPRLERLKAKVKKMQRILKPFEHAHDMDLAQVTLAMQRVHAGEESRKQAAQKPCRDKVPGATMAKVNKKVPCSNPFMVLTEEESDQADTEPETCSALRYKLGDEVCAYLNGK